MLLCAAMQSRSQNSGTFEIFCGAIKQAPNIIQNGILWTLKRLKALCFKDGGNMNSARAVCDPAVQWLQLFICKHGRAPFFVDACESCIKDSVAEEQRCHRVVFARFNRVFSVLCRTRRLWKMSANRSSNSGRTTAADQKPKEKAMMVFNFN